MSEKFDESLMSFKENTKAFEFEKYKFDRNLIFKWDSWVWKTMLAREIWMRKNLEYCNANNTSVIPYSHKCYFITDWEFKKYNDSKMLGLAKKWESIKEYPFEKMLACRVLIYDDIWTVKTSEAYISQLFQVLDQREKYNREHKDKKINIFTTNLWYLELKDIYWDRIAWRILKGSKIFIMDWKNQRLENNF